MNPNSAPNVIGPRDGQLVDLGSFGIRFMVESARSGGGFSLVEHPMGPRALGAPLHRHANEDEYSFVLEGRMGARLGDEVVHADVGDLVVKPRGQWHTFWNAGDEPARILEIISPGGFEEYFRRLGELVAAGQEEKIGELAASYDMELDPSSVPELCAEHGLTFGP